MRANISRLFIILFIILSQCHILEAQELERVISLDELFILADNNNKKIKSAEQSVKLAESSVKTAQNPLLPEINLSASASYNGNVWMSDRNFSNGVTLKGPHFGNNFAFEVSQIIYAGGAIRHSIRSAELQSELSRLDFDSQRQQVYFLLTGYYLNLYKFRNMLKVVDRNIDRVHQVISDMRAREEQGIVLSNDITRYEVQLQNLLYRKTEIQGQIEVFNYQLTTSVGLPENTRILPDTALLQIAMKPYTVTEWGEMSQDNSPSLKIGRQNISISKEREKIARSGLFPKINVFAGDHLQGPITFELPPLNKNLNNWYFGVSLSYSISNIYKSKRDINQSRIATALASSKYNEMQEQIDQAVHEAYISYENSFELLNTQKKSLQLASENYAITENRYNNDLALLIDLLDADNIKLDAEIEYINARINIIFNYYRLLYITGTL